MHALKSPFGLPRLLISQYDMQTLIKEFFFFSFVKVDRKHYSRILVTRKIEELINHKEITKVTFWLFVM
jgi:hypothetical protein